MTRADNAFQREGWSACRVEDQLQAVGEAVLGPLFAQGTGDVQLVTACLDLLPTAVACLAALRARGGGGAGGGGGWGRTDHIDLLESVFFVQWSAPLLLPVASVLCELSPHLSSSQRRQLQERLLGAGRMGGQGGHGEDFAGLLRVCFRLFEQR
jgi:hypothetical protein